MKITVLTENISFNENNLSEHGLSLFIETEEDKILFDMGQSDLFAKNAEKLGVNLKEINLAVLSHGHYDHGGGLEKFLEINSNAKIYVNENAFLPYYNGREKYIGLNVNLKDNKRIIFTGNEFKINNKLTLYTLNGIKKKYDLGSFGLNKKEGNKFIPDDFLHEHYLLIEEKGKRILISGCSHKGILDIALYFKADVILGGFHFSKLPLDDKLKEYAEILNDTGTAFYTCHCTGVEQYNFMKRYMSKLHYLSSGSIIEI